MAAGKQPLYKSLYFQVIVAIVVGILLGHFFPATGEAMKPLGDGFIKLIKMMIAPIIFCTVVVGIAGMEDMKKVGKTGGLALLYFEILSTVALIVGLIIVNVVKPGVGMNIDPATLDTKSVAAYTGPGKMTTTTEFLLNLIPNTIVDAFAKGDILQVLLFSVLFGFALHALGAVGRPFYHFIDQLPFMLRRHSRVDGHSSNMNRQLHPAFPLKQVTRLAYFVSPVTTDRSLHSVLQPCRMTTQG